MDEIAGLEAFDEVERLLVVAAHPDDLETMCGGTLVLLRERSVAVDLLLATDGDLGSQSDDDDRPAVATTRRAETRAAADELGIERIEFLGYGDGELVNDLRLRRQVAGAYRRLQPDTIFTFDPLAAYRSNLHPDHIAISQAAIDAFMPAKMPLFAPEQLGAGVTLSRVSRIFCFATLEPDVIVPVDGVYEQKLALARHHRSQFPEGDESLEWMKRRDRDRAAAVPETEYAEGFRRIATY